MSIARLGRLLNKKHSSFLHRLELRRVGIVDEVRRNRVVHIRHQVSSSDGLNLGRALNNLLLQGWHHDVAFSVRDDLRGVASVLNLLLWCLDIDGTFSLSDNLWSITNMFLKLHLRLRQSW